MQSVAESPGLAPGYLGVGRRANDAVRVLLLGGEMCPTTVRNP